MSMSLERGVYVKRPEVSQGLEQEKHTQDFKVSFCIYLSATFEENCASWVFE